MDELRRRASEAVQNGRGYLTLILPDERPWDFPESELLAINGRQKVYRVSAFKVLKWLKSPVPTGGER